VVLGITRPIYKNIEIEPAYFPKRDNANLPVVIVDDFEVIADYTYRGLGIRNFRIIS